MAHSISSTRALQAEEVQQRSDTDYIRTFLCACGRGCESNRLLTSTSEVLSLSGRLAGAQEETHKQAVCEQESSFPHFASKRAHFSITQENKQKHSSKSVGRLSATVCYKTLCSSAAGLLILTQRCTLFHFSFNLLFLWAARRTPLRFSTLLHRIR